MSVFLIAVLFLVVIYTVKSIHVRHMRALAKARRDWPVVKVQ